MALSYSLWTGIPTPLALGVGGKCVQGTRLVTFVLGGLRRSGNNLRRKDLTLKGSTHALRALFLLR